MSNNFNMSFDPATRQAFGELVADYGLTIPQAFKLFANQSIKTGTLALSFDWRANTSASKVPSEKLLKAMAELESDDLPSYTSVDDLLRACNERV